MVWTNSIVTAPTTDITERARAGLRMVIESLASRYATANAADQAGEQAVLGDAQRTLAAKLGDNVVPMPALSAPANTALLTSAARTTTTPSADQVNTGAGLVARGGLVIVNVTSAGTGSITPSIQRKNSDGSYTNIVTAAAALTTNTKGVLLLDPLVGTQTAAADFDGVLDAILPQTWRLNVVANNGNAVTYSADAYLIR